ncbi:hypothetical protein [Laspinema palackyanum]
MGCVIRLGVRDAALFPLNLCFLNEAAIAITSSCDRHEFPLRATV